MTTSDDITENCVVLIEELGELVTWVDLIPLVGADPVPTQNTYSNVRAALVGAKRQFGTSSVEAQYDRTAYILTQDLPVEPSQGDQLIDNSGKTWQVVSWQTRAAAGIPILYVLGLQR